MLEKALDIKSFIIDARRTIHRRPELGYREYDTAKYVMSKLDELGVSYKAEVARTGVVADISQGPGPTVMIRADMDALPIQEDTGLEYQSQNPGVMHACGHDTHTAMVLGAAKLLKNETFQGTIRFLFQPAEEGNYDDPDGYSGAQRAIHEGVLDGVDAAIGLHQIPTMPTGVIAVTKGSVLAAADFFEITITGNSSHAGVSPEKGIDAVVISAELILSLQTIVSRHINAKNTAVVSVCTIEGGSAANIIADNVRLTGTTRALDEETHREINRLIQKRCDALAELYDTKIEFNRYYSVPVTVNDLKIADIVAHSALSIFGQSNVFLDTSIMGGEDFAYIAQKVPSCFALLGTKNPHGEAHPLHSAKMTVNEDALPLGTAYLAKAALDLLQTIGMKSSA